MSTIGERIKEARKSAGVKQQELAKRLNIDKSAVCKWESGAAQPDISKIRMIAETLSVSVEYILVGEDKSESHSEQATITQEERKLIVAYRALSKDEKCIVLRIVESLAITGQ